MKKTTPKATKKAKSEVKKRADTKKKAASKTDKYQLSEDELKIKQSIENNEWRDIPSLEKEMARYKEAAKHTVSKNKRVNLRITTQDFYAAHIKAREEGIPYQTLLASIIHKYLTGQLTEKNRHR